MLCVFEAFHVGFLGIPHLVVYYYYYYCTKKKPTALIILRTLHVVVW